MSKRAIYRLLVRLHPAEFREQFGLEMLWVFESAAGGPGLLWDGALSLVRQWTLRAIAWKIPASLSLACLPLLLIFGGFQRHAVQPATRPVDVASLTRLMWFILECALVLVGGLSGAVLWFRSFSARRNS